MFWFCIFVALTYNQTSEKNYVFWVIYLAAFVFRIGIISRISAYFPSNRRSISPDRSWFLTRDRAVCFCFLELDWIQRIEASLYLIWICQLKGCNAQSAMNIKNGRLFTREILLKFVSKINLLSIRYYRHYFYIKYHFEIIWFNFYTSS